MASYRCLLPLLEGDDPLRMSYSQLFECVILLARDEYIMNADRDFVGRLCAMKQRRIDEEMRTHRPTPRRGLHVTIGDEALGFLDMLASRYRMLLRTRSDVASLILRQVGERVTSREKTEWMKRRIEEVLLKYPVRYGR